MRPFEGRTFLVAASERVAGRLTERLREGGGIPIPFPTVRIEAPRDERPLDDAVRDWASFDWVVFTSANGVDAVATRARSLDVSLGGSGPRIAAVGPATREAAEAAGLSVSAMPERFLTDAIAETLGDLRGRKVLLPRSSEARKSLAEALRVRGANLVEVDAYSPAPAKEGAAAPAPSSRIDFLVFTSASVARHFADAISREELDRMRRVPAACIGPVTAEAARALGFEVRVIAAEHSVAGLVRSLEEALAHG